MRHPLIALAAFLLLAAGGVAAHADDKWYGELDKLEEARARGTVMPLAELLGALGIDPRSLVEIEVDEEDDRLVYEIYYLDPAGRRHEVVVDAATGAVIYDEDEH